eukprot:4216720-Pyramimonas_sp.AAC.1
MRETAGTSVHDMHLDSSCVLQDIPGDADLLRKTGALWACFARVPEVGCLMIAPMCEEEERLWLRWTVPHDLGPANFVVRDVPRVQNFVGR